jgi:hypothetical protein
LGTRRDKSRLDSKSADALRIWASLFSPALASWNPLGNMVKVAEAEAQKLKSRLDALLNTSDASLRGISLCEPLRADLGLNRWLKKEREEAYSDWLEWILQQLQQLPGRAANVLKVIGISDSAVLTASENGIFKMEREYWIPDRRLDLVLTLDDSLIVVIEVKKYSAETADTEKQAPYYEWLKQRRFRWRKALLLVADASEDRYHNFDRLLWEHLCIRLRLFLPELAAALGPVKAAMFVAFIGAVETNLLNFVAPRDTDDIERLSYAKTIEHLQKCGLTI